MLCARDAGKMRSARYDAMARYAERSARRYVVDATLDTLIVDVLSPFAIDAD